MYEIGAVIMANNYSVNSLIICSLFHEEVLEEMNTILHFIVIK